MSIITRMRKQVAVYWGAPVADGEGGFTYAAPVQFGCRWDDRTVLFVNYKGEETISSAVIYPDQDMVFNGSLWLGTLVALQAAYPTTYTNPRLVVNTRVIMGIGKIPNLRASEYLRILHVV